VRRPPAFDGAFLCPEPRGVRRKEALRRAISIRTRTALRANPQDILADKLRPIAHGRASPDIEALLPAAKGLTQFPLKAKVAAAPRETQPRAGDHRWAGWRPIRATLSMVQP